MLKIFLTLISSHLISIKTDVSISWNFKIHPKFYSICKKKHLLFRKSCAILKK